MISNNDILKILGDKLKTARAKKGYTQEYVAENINVSTDLLRNIENGRNIGSLSTLLNICNILGTTPNDLFTELLTSNLGKSGKDKLLFSYINDLSEKDKALLKKIILHIDKNY